MPWNAYELGGSLGFGTRAPEYRSTGGGFPWRASCSKPRTVAAAGKANHEDLVWRDAGSGGGRLGHTKGSSYFIFSCMKWFMKDESGPSSFSTTDDCHLVVIQKKFPKLKGFTNVIHLSTKENTFLSLQTLPEWSGKKWINSAKQ